MKAVLRVCWTLFTAFRVQRWFGVAGLVVLAIGFFIGIVGLFNRSDATLGFPLGLYGCFALVVIPTAFLAGATLRALSVPSAHALLPRFRVRILLALALFVASVGLPVYGVGLALELFGGPRTEVAAMYVAAAYVVGGLTAVVLFGFVVTGNPNWMWLMLPGMFAFSQWMDVGGPQRLVAAGFSFPGVVAAASAAAWLSFAIWYLRVGRIRPVLLIAPERGWSEMWWRRSVIRPAKRWPAELTRERAIGTLLTGRLQPTFPRQLLIAAGVGVALCFIAPLLRYLPGDPGDLPKTPPLTTFVFPFYATLFVAFGSNLVVRQSRHLWLRVPGSRIQVFRVIERRMARLYARVVTCIAAFVLASLWLFETPLDEAAWGFALMSSAALYSACMALAAVRTVWLVAGGMVFIFAVQMVVLMVLAQQPGPPVDPPGVTQLAATVGIQLAGAALFRGLAELRWRSIDWLKFRPLRIGRSFGYSGTRG
jgi:hypothetical protein